MTYPRFIQFETRRRELQRELRLHAERAAASAVRLPAREEREPYEDTPSAEAA